MKNVICINCRKHVEYELKYVKVKTFVKGEEVVYTQVVAHCKECGAEVWAEEVDDLNSIAPIVAYCEMVGLITPIQIQEGLKKYNIGSRPLSKLLGWSEVTITRYLNGKIPTKEYSDKLMEIFNNPECFEKILLKNKGKIKPIAYKKALKSLNRTDYSVEEISCFVVPYNSCANINYTVGKMQGGVNGWHRPIYSC